jgi:hypothetical protein
VIGLRDHLRKVAVGSHRYYSHRCSPREAGNSTGNNVSVTSRSVLALLKAGELPRGAVVDEGDVLAGHGTVQLKAPGASFRSSRPRPADTAGASELVLSQPVDQL